MSDSSRPHGLQPTRCLHPWDFPGKSTGVGCHRLLRPTSIPPHNCHIKCTYCPHGMGNQTWVAKEPKCPSSHSWWEWSLHRNPGCEMPKCSWLLPWLSSTSSHHVAFEGLKLCGWRDTEEDQLKALKKKAVLAPKRLLPDSILDATAFKLLVYNQAILKPDLQDLQKRPLWFSKADMFGILGGRSNPLWCSVFNKISSAEIRDTPVNF